MFLPASIGRRPGRCHPGYEPVAQTTGVEAPPKGAEITVQPNLALEGNGLSQGGLNGFRAC